MFKKLALVVAFGIAVSTDVDAATNYKCDVDVNDKETPFTAEVVDNGNSFIATVHYVGKVQVFKSPRLKDSKVAHKAETKELKVGYINDVFFMRQIMQNKDIGFAVIRDMQNGEIGDRVYFIGCVK